MLRWGFQRQQPTGTAVDVDLVERPDVVLGCLRGAGRQVEDQRGGGLPATVGVERLALDGEPSLGETVDDRAHQRRQVGRDLGRQPRPGAGRRKGQLADDVLDVGLGGEEQVGGDLAERDVVARLGGGVEVELLVPHGEQLFFGDVGGARAAPAGDLRPDDLPVVLERRSPAFGEASDETEPPPGQRLLGRPSEQRRKATPVTDLDPQTVADGHDLDAGAPPAMQHGVRHQLAQHELGVVGQLLVPELGRPPNHVGAGTAHHIRVPQLSRRALRPVHLGTKRTERGRWCCHRETRPPACSTSAGACGRTSAGIS